MKGLLQNIKIIINSKFRKSPLIYIKKKEKTYRDNTKGLQQIDKHKNDKLKALSVSSPNNRIHKYQDPYLVNKNNLLLNTHGIVITIILHLLIKLENDLYDLLYHLGHLNYLQQYHHHLMKENIMI